MKKLLFPLLFLFLAACAKSPQVPTPPVGDAWQEMLKISAANSDKPCRIQFSLRFGEEGNTRRVTAILWSNDNDSVRMDVSAGVGVTVAKVLDEKGHFILVSPNENRVYENRGQERPLLRIGSPLPFDLSRLANILSGNYACAFAEFPEADSDSSYVLPEPPGGRLELAANGLPEAWTSPRWTLRLSYYEGETVPHRLRLESADGKIAILLVKERDYPAEPFSAAQMELKIPPEARVLPLAAYKN